MADINFKVWFGLLKKLVDMGDGTHAEQSIAHPPFDLLTDGGDGTNRRIRVDPGQTGFFARREFRIVREFSSVAGADAGVIPTGQSVLIRSIVPINTILMSLRFSADQGHLRMTTWRGGAPTIGGVAATFPNAMTAIPANAMTEAAAYSPQVVTAASNASATVVMTGSARVDVERVKVATATGQASTAQAAEDDQRGVSAETYYIWIQNISAGDLEGVLKARYEERP